jgi:hypothetical protein
MAVEDVRLRARRELEEIGVSVESAAYLAEDRPPGGWDSLVTRDVLRAEIAELRASLTWRLATLVVASQGVVVAAIAVIVSR